MHVLWLMLDGPGHWRFRDADVSRAIGGPRGLWKLWKQARVTSGAAIEMRKEAGSSEAYAEEIAEIELALDGLRIAAICAIRESLFGERRHSHVRQCARELLNMARELDRMRTSVTG